MRRVMLITLFGVFLTAAVVFKGQWKSETSGASIPAPTAGSHENDRGLIEMSNGMQDQEINISASVGAAPVWGTTTTTTPAAVDSPLREDEEVRVINIGEPIDAEAGSYQAQGDSTEIMNIGEPIDAEAESVWEQTGTAEVISLGDTINADDPSSWPRDGEASSTINYGTPMSADRSPNDQFNLASDDTISVGDYLSADIPPNL